MIMFFIITKRGFLRKMKKETIRKIKRLKRKAKKERSKAEIKKRATENTHIKIFKGERRF